MDKISVETFCKGIPKGNNKALQDYYKKHIVTDYVPYLQKDVMCTSIINATCKVKDNDREFVRINSSGRYLMFMLKLIDLYSDIKIDFKDSKFIEQYDVLNKSNAIDGIISAIPESEYSEFSALLQMKYDDFINNEYSLTAMLYNFKQSLSLSEEVINSVIEEFGKITDNEE